MPETARIRNAQMAGARQSVATKFCTVTPHTCRPSVQNMLHVTLTAARILRCVPEFSQICVGPSRELDRGVKLDWTGLILH